MKYLNLTKQFAALAISALVFASCDKVDVQKSIGDSGQTLVKILGGGTPATIKKNPVDFVNTPTTIVCADIRRDIPNSTELNKVMVVTVKNDNAAVATANPAYVILPSAWYTVGAATPFSGGNYTVTMQPGEFAKEIKITIPNATLMDPSTLYALGFTITTADANGVISTQKSVVVEIGAKNNWDGVYMMSGTFSDVSNPVFAYAGDQQYSLITIGATKCVVRNDDLNGGIPGYIFDNAGAGTYYGSYGLVISFNPANNAIADLWNYYGDPTLPATSGGTPSAGTGPPLYAASNGRRAVLDPSGVNAVQANKNIIIKHWMYHPSVVPVGPRSFFNETWTYDRPR
ncbi:MAG: hypothetical protein IPI66_09835 [Chitinophagaceae bacterium]|nr:hypothetical protein [Chitinophagaceae bacterium]MBL0057508.1 hypothetical protein [Chitinophagaceae bacterium]